MNSSLKIMKWWKFRLRFISMLEQAHAHVKDELHWSHIDASLLKNEKFEQLLKEGGWISLGYFWNSGLFQEFPTRCDHICGLDCQEQPRSKKRPSIPMRMFWDNLHRTNPLLVNYFYHLKKKFLKKKVNREFRCANRARLAPNPAEQHLFLEEERAGHRCAAANPQVCRFHLSWPRILSGNGLVGENVWLLSYFIICRSRCCDSTIILFWRNNILDYVSSGRRHLTSELLQSDITWIAGKTIYIFTSWSWWNNISLDVDYFSFHFIRFPKTTCLIWGRRTSFPSSDEVPRARFESFYRRVGRGDLSAHGQLAPHSLRLCSAH